ncbi:HAMP domain-containing sensor histidine kinase [Desulfocurvibacter africanus]|uniref:PAS domain-containing sensor histidine kinase n=1 Tax=Desulfocurvibacter africanus TaxID=873 RepID=UPI002FDB2163
MADKPLKGEDIQTVGLNAPEQLSAACEREASMYAAAILDALKEPLLILNSELRVASANLPYYSHFQSTPKETIGRHLHDLGDRQWDIPRLRDSLQGLISGAWSFDGLMVEREFEQIGKRTVVLSGRRLRQREDLSPKLLLLIEDITDRILAEQELEARVRDVIDLKHDVFAREDVDRMYRHDLKTPLVAVVGFARLLRADQNLTDKQREMLEIIEESGYRMQAMINLSMDLYRMEVGTYVPKPSPVDLVALVKHVLNDVEMLVRQRRLNVEASVDSLPLGEAKPVVVGGNDTLFHAMLGNIVKNAVEASPEESGIGITVESNEEQVKVSVHNRGEIPQQVRGKLFKKYISHGKKEGSGLGVYNASLIARNFGGELGYESSAQGGTTAWIQLPRSVPGRAGDPPARTS